MKQKLAVINGRALTSIIGKAKTVFFLRLLELDRGFDKLIASCFTYCMNLLFVLIVILKMCWSIEIFKWTWFIYSCSF